MESKWSVPIGYRCIDNDKPIKVIMFTDNFGTHHGIRLTLDKVKHEAMARAYGHSWMFRAFGRDYIFEVVDKRLLVVC